LPSLKGSLTRDFGLFQKSVSPGPWAMSILLGPFQIFTIFAEIFFVFMPVLMTLAIYYR
jgi:hypothetical protein